MKKLAAALLFLLGLTCAASAQAVGPTNQVFCNQIATLTAGPTTLTQVVPAVAGKSIFVCGWHVTNTGATGTFGFSNGTGSNCGTGTATIIPPQNVTSSAPSNDHIDYAAFQVPVSNAFCILPSVATIAAIVYYSQF